MSHNNRKQELKAGAPIRLSARLEAVASFVPQGARTADIGTDHGYIPIFLVQSGRCPSAIAMDVRKGPLERARAHVAELGLSGQIGLRLSDGLRELKPGEADAVVIAGMGGELMVRILSQGRHMWESVSAWVLSPQSEIGRVRAFLAEEGFQIVKEAMVEEDGKYYTVMAAGRGHMEFQNEAGLRYGALLLGQRDPLLGEFLSKEEKRVRSIMEGLQRVREAERTRGQQEALKQLEGELQVIKEAQHEMRNDH